MIGGLFAGWDWASFFCGGGVMFVILVGCLTWIAWGLPLPRMVKRMLNIK